jgi:hypothetical protein
MSERALAFLEEWTAENVDPDDEAPEDIDARAKELADQFLAAAAAEGIPKAEIDDVVDDLPGFMASQIEEANEREEDEDDEDEEIEDRVKNEVEDELDDEEDEEKKD